MSDITYNRVIRKLVVGFGSLFDKITLVRYNTDRSEDQRVLVPLAYATKELYVRRLMGIFGSINNKLNKYLNLTNE